MTTSPTVTFKVGRCPACQTDIRAEAAVAIEVDEPMSGPDPRQEGKISLNGRIVGATIAAHDCRPKVTR